MTGITLINGVAGNGRTYTIRDTIQVTMNVQADSEQLARQHVAYQISQMLKTADIKREQANQVIVQITDAKE